jgi:predicted DNA-binding transcriptional regulator YafY
VRASRLVSILLLLQVHGRLPASELAARLEVSVRTVYRDLAALGEAGVPVFALPGPGGGCGLVEGYRTRLTGLTTDEAQALFLAGVPGPAGELGLGTSLAAAQLKLLAALPEPLRARAERAGDRFHVDAPRWFDAAGGADPAHLLTIAGAVWEDRRLRLGYQRQGRPPAVRVVEPLGLVLKAGVWYLVARVPDGRDPHVYRLSRVVSADGLDESFDRPPGFDLAGFWSSWVSDYAAGLPRIQVRVRLAPDALPAARWSAIEVSAGPPDQDGWLPATLVYERLEHAVGGVLAMGGCAEALAPPELRERVAEAAHAMAGRYPRPTSASRAQ